MISIHKLSKRYGSITALDGVSLHVREGEFFGLVGPNGAGKSTLMNILSGYTFADEGRLELNGHRLKEGDPEGCRILGLVPQSLALYEDFNAVANLEIFGSLYEIPKKELKERIQYWLEKVQLWDRRKDKVKGFSGGMKRRLNLVEALLHEPKILLCDEPTVGVDPQSRNAIFDFLEEQNQAGLTIVYTTHYMEEVERMCKQIAIIDSGHIIAEGTRSELVSSLPSITSIAYESGHITDRLKQALSEMGEINEEGDHATFIPGDGFKLSAFFE